jgi:hypothetical protein
MEAQQMEYGVAPMYVNNFDVNQTPDFDDLERKIDSALKLVQHDIGPDGFLLLVLREIAPKVIKDDLAISYSPGDKYSGETVSLSFRGYDPRMVFNSTGMDHLAGVYPCTSVGLVRMNFQNPFHVSKKKEQFLKVVERKPGDVWVPDDYWCMPSVELTNGPSPSGWDIPADPEWFERGSTLIRKAAAKFDLATAWLPAYETYMEEYRKAEAEAERKAAERPKGLLARLFRT